MRAVMASGRLTGPTAVSVHDQVTLASRLKGCDDVADARLLQALGIHCRPVWHACHHVGDGQLLMRDAAVSVGEHRPLAVQIGRGHRGLASRESDDALEADQPSTRGKETHPESSCRIHERNHDIAIPIRLDHGDRHSQRLCRRDKHRAVRRGGCTNTPSTIEIPVETYRFLHEQATDLQAFVTAMYEVRDELLNHMFITRYALDRRCEALLATLREAEG